MTETVKVNGMMCEMCEKHVKKSLEKIDGVNSADVSHVKGTAVIDVTKQIPEDELKKAVEDAGYKYAGVEA